MTRISTVAFACLALVFQVALARQSLSADDKATLNQQQLEEQFADKMSGATLAGRFTTREQGVEQPLAEDRYTLGRVHKLPNGLWSFETRIQYGGKDVKVALALHVKWAGDTPVITLDNVLVPGLGTFNARVLVYGDEYAGTWSGGNHGGHLFGRITTTEAAEADKSN